MATPDEPGENLRLVRAKLVDLRREVAALIAKVGSKERIEKEAARLVEIQRAIDAVDKAREGEKKGSAG